ncbi:cysteine-rich tail protein 1 [Ochotona princeps]|uniref:cysteine-rich tail protein 1 n=1 Tax=Ochotona princeps TaxID=9978 RepID=UPI0027153532|nr:cysteine-rich tail protein 1 [Ochotona princeps]
MDPHEMVVKNPYTHISIPRAQLRPDLGPASETTPGASSTSEAQPLPGAPAPQPTETKGAGSGQQAWGQPSNPYGCGQRPEGLTYSGQPPVGRGDDIAHHCCCCPCCPCCHCPRFCRCHSCCVVS